jgi:hypothetical protein
MRAATIHTHGSPVKPVPGSFGKCTGGTEVRRVVLMFTVNVVAPEAGGVTLDVEAEHDARAGSPAQEIMTGELNPATELTLTVTLAVSPATTVVLPPETATLKSGPFPVPVPVSRMICGELAALSVMVNEPTLCPETLGVNVTPMVQVEAGTVA